MPHFSIHRFTVAALFVLAISTIGSSVSFGGIEAYLNLKGSNGQSYKATPDASGKFTFEDVEPGTYRLLFVGSPAIFESAHPPLIEIQSFSWGTAVSDSNQSHAPKQEINSIPAPKIISFKRQRVVGTNYYTVVIDNIVVTGTSSPSGKLRGWNLIENVK